MSTEKQFETSQTPHLLIEQVHGNMQVRAWGEARVSVTGSGRDYRFTQEGDEIRLGNFDDCRIFVPVAASITVQETHGNAIINGVRGQISVEQIHGNLRGDELGATRIGRVDGDMLLREVDGPLSLGHVGGNANASEVKGNVQLEHVGGNCALREVEGEITLERVRGNLNINEAHAVSLDKVSGNMIVKDVNGSVTVNKVAGNLVATECMGDLAVDKVGGDLKAREIAGRINARVGGTAYLNLQESIAPFASVHAGGDIRCYVPLTVDARFELRAGSDVVIRNLPTPNQNQQLDASQYDFTLGSGEGHLEFTSGNRIRLIGAEESTTPDWDMDFEFQFQGDFNERATELVQQVAEQVEAQVEAFTRQLNERLSQLDSGDAIASKVQMKVQSAMRQAEEKIAEAMRRAERQSERQAERQAAREARVRVRGVGPMPPVPPMPPMPPVPPSGNIGGLNYVRVPSPAPTPKRTPPSSEERMLVLKMLEEGKITVAQAEQLLAAMGE